MDRRLLVVIAVVGLHVLGLWALQAGLLGRAVELVVPVQVLADWVEAPPQPAPQIPTTASAPKPDPAPRSTPKPSPVAQPAPLPVAATTPIAEPSVPTVQMEPQPLVQPAAQPAVSAAASAPDAPSPPSASPARSAPPTIELPKSSAEYLNNPKPPYPRMSKTLEEEGTVVVRVLVEPNGAASKAELHASSGFRRLDEAAVQAVLRWRFIPGKRAGVAEAMWFNVPVTFDINSIQPQSRTQNPTP